MGAVGPHAQASAEPRSVRIRLYVSASGLCLGLNSHHVIGGKRMFPELAHWLGELNWSGEPDVLAVIHKILRICAQKQQRQLVSHQTLRFPNVYGPEENFKNHHVAS